MRTKGNGILIYRYLKITNLKDGNMEATDVVKEEAIQKIRDHINTASICMVSNNVLEWTLSSESLQNQYLDSLGNVWFLCRRDDPNSTVGGRMEVFYSNRLKGSFLSLVGDVDPFSWEDARSVDGLPFNEKDTGDHASSYLAKFVPTEAFYWDEKTGDMTPLPLFNTVRLRTSKLVA